MPKNKHKINSLEEIMKKAPEIPINKFMPKQPGSKNPRILLADRIVLLLTNNRKPLGNVVHVIGETAGGVIGFTLRIMGNLIKGKEKIEKVIEKEPISIWQWIVKMFKEIFKIK